MRTLAIGDVHGCSTALDSLLAAIGPRPEEPLIFLGDYVDRGPDSRGVLDRVIALHTDGKAIALRGNHDVMMVQAGDGIDVGMWLACGGERTLESYGVLALGKYFPRELIPESHWGFLQAGLVDWHETEEHIFVHAGVYPDLPLDEQPDYMLHWEKLVEPVAHCSGKVIVCGHTKQRSGMPLDLGTIICIDTGVYEPNGWLTGLDVLSGRYWQANEKGETRGGWLGESSRAE
jgi:serine/threonine protein phosphatase 1